MFSGDSNGSANANNDLGQITGSTGDCFSHPNAHAVLWDNGKVINLGSLGGAMNQQSRQPSTTWVKLPAAPIFPVIPSSMLSFGHNGVMQDLGTLPGDSSSFGSSINNLGQIVGQSCDAEFQLPCLPLAKRQDD